MSLYGKYIKERLNHDIVENEMGFASFSYEPEGVYIRDIYVHPAHRHEEVASDLADQIMIAAKSKGYHTMFGTVQPSANGSTSSLRVLLAYGFKLHSSQNDFIIMEKSI